MPNTTPNSKSKPTKLRDSAGRAANVNTESVSVASANAPSRVSRQKEQQAAHA